MSERETVSTTRRWAVFSARKPFRLVAGVLALPSIASAAVPFALDMALMWQLVFAVTCVVVGALFGAVALRGTVRVPMGSLTVSRA